MLRSVKIGSKLLSLPIIQGGMGVGVSLSNLAGHVMKEGGMGVISAAHPGYCDPDFRKNPVLANYKAIIEEAKKARAISQGQGLLGINIMAAGKEYATMVKAAVEAKYDAIISGAGLPLYLPKLVEDGTILLAPIVSSGRAMKLIASTWDRRYQRTPDFVVIEGCEAGGHLGFKKEDILSDCCQSLEAILTDVKKELEPYRKKYHKDIPVFVAGGVYTGSDIAHYIELGASGVQMGTRFIATHECDADIRFKEAVISAKKEDITIVQSPTGFPGRAVLNEFMKKVKERGNISIQKCLNCLTPCTPQNTPYCITEALIQAVKGNVNNGLVFVGTNAWRLEKIVSVKELISELVEEANYQLREERK